ncbi:MULTISPECIES: nitric-oxide reductase large subunit [Chryseobacterium]|uniref:Nitric oxide reductase subunit B n=3 Tax=Chryseobacterium TaxID=59732 RepID=A0AAX2IKQ8_9FLAO|nr:MULTISPECIES: nitric-oxide reductase large subunit [Chryseobacterium]AYM99156.1 nitric-oxide reductase large subunit [Chryseobacterium sp. 3008163]AZA60144.1 nitric-oxide reductase large subunit [Chryseobacterium indoltheticum]AZB29662.1 nitric-oxide reductase large subunit [Chryseobacterium balustinum]SFZ93194.1 nitric oxide reductase, NorZ apoprotein [Chryseobacterium limigenitum]SKB92459.1 nitric oxide reductase, NorZ apoprotein [Chryseobacterium balustinum]
MTTKKLWTWLAAVIIGSFAVLIYYGVDIYRKIPPVPDKVVTADGTVMATGQDIKDGQNVWQSIGGQTVGSIWGHGAYIAPDWSADYLHRESLLLLDELAKKDGKTYKDLPDDEQARYKVLLKREIRKNTLDEATQTIVISPERAKVQAELAEYYAKIFMNDAEMNQLRDHYAIPKNTVKTEERMAKMNAFFSWAAWVCITDRPGDTGITYTNNWPHDELIGNIPPPSLHLWSGFSVLMLLGCVGLLVFYHAKNKEEEISEMLPLEDPLRSMKPTASMRATLKYIWVVALLILVQMFAGVITAHYGVEGSGFYGFPLDEFLPQSISRSWHVQLAIFWIATSWLATGLYIAPAVSGYEPKYQVLGVNILFGALLIVVFGSLAGQWLGVMQKLGYVDNFLWGHSGYEYVELGRIWQILLLVGLILWLILMVRALLPALKKKDGDRHLLLLFTLSAVAIALFYGAGLMYGRQTHMAIAEYWRWWVVHLWVEGFFEVFATVVAAFLFTRLGLLRLKAATHAVLFSTIIFLAGGILGTFHHLYFSATPTAVLALGATFSALEIVPLVLIGFEAYQNYQISKSTKWIKAYKWPIYCFIAMCFWNFLGAGIFGFAINPPIALYYIQGLNTTAVHGHAALFGVYGILGIGLMMFMLRGLYPDREWNDKLIGWAFWLTNIGLLVMVTISLLPIGIMQSVASIKEGYWYARSAEFMQTDMMHTLRWLRVPGDILLAIGEMLLVIFIIGLKTGWSLKDKR